MAKGLRLTIPGATGEPYSIQGVPGLFRRDTPMPVGHPGEITLEEAERLSADENIPLELVDLEDEVAAREQMDADLAAARQAIPATMDMGLEGAEPSRVEDQIRATAPVSDQPEPAAVAPETEEG